MTDSWEAVHERPAPAPPTFNAPLRIAVSDPKAIGRPPALLSLDRRNSSTATAASLLGDLHADLNPGMLSEFDLFNGELLGGEGSIAGGAHRAS